MDVERLIFLTETGIFRTFKKCLSLEVLSIVKSFINKKF